MPGHRKGFPYYVPCSLLGRIELVPDVRSVLNHWISPVRRRAALHQERGDSMKRVTLCCAAAVTAALLGSVAGYTTATAAPVNPLVAHQAAVQAAADQAPALAGTLGLGSQEKLVVKDVVTDANGTRHLRYDRTYAGMKVLGGDLVVDESAAGAVANVTYANPARIAPAAAPKLSANAAAADAIASVAGSNLARSAPQLVVYAIDTAPTLAYETVVT